MVGEKPYLARLPPALKVQSWQVRVALAENEVKIPPLDRKLIRTERSRQGQKLDSLFCR